MLKALIDDGVEDRDPLAELLAYPRRADGELRISLPNMQVLGRLRSCVLRE